MKQQPIPGLDGMVANLLKHVALKTPQRRFLQLLLSLWLVLPGRVNAQTLARYSGHSERRFRRWLHRPQPPSAWTPLHLGVIAQMQAQGQLGQHFILAIDASFIRKSGRHTPGLGSFWNGCASRSERGLELSCAALIDVERRQAFPIEVRQTHAKGAQADRLQQYESQLVDVLGQCRHYPDITITAVVGDGQYAKTQFMDAVTATDQVFVTKLQKNANLLYLYTGAPATRRGRPRLYDGKVDWDDLSRFTLVSATSHERVWTHILWAPHFKRLLRVVVVERLKAQGQRRAYAVLCSTDISMSAPMVQALYSARFEIEFVFRDAKQYTGLNTCQLRSTAGLEAHWNTALLVVSLMRAATLAATPPDQAVVFSLEDHKRRAYNVVYARRILADLGLEARFEELCSAPADTLNFGVKAA